MRIGIIGSGNIGATAAQLFARAGHDVAISNSRGPETLQELVDHIGPNVRAVTVEEELAGLSWGGAFRGPGGRSTGRTRWSGR